MILTQTEPAAVLPVTLVELKAHLRIDHADEDTLLETYLAAAARVAEDRLRRTLITTEWRMAVERFPRDGMLRLARPPITSIDAVEFYDTEETLTTLDAEDYSADLAGARLRRPLGVLWPATAPRDDAVAISYTAGYGDAPEDVPAHYRLAILYLAAHYYSNREPVSIGQLAPLPLAIEALLANRNLEFA